MQQNDRSTSPSIALVAGEGLMPEVMLCSMQQAGYRVLILAIHNITSKSLASQADDVVWLHITQLGKAINCCQERKIERIAFAGRIAHKSIFTLSILHMDITTMKLWFSLADKRADTLLGAIVKLFATRGIITVETKEFLATHLAPEGVLSKAKPTQRMLEEILFALPLVKQIGRLDIGQTIVVKNHSIVAVEAIEGTDACLERAGMLAGAECVAIKVAKPQQDPRFDLPVIGLNTIEKLVKIGASALAIEAQQVLILDSAALDYANRHGLVVVSLRYINS